MENRRTLTTEQAQRKARQYCAYQERSHAETRRKLQGFGLRRAQVDEILAQLISDGYLNEERFATAFAGGKFRVKGWGRNRIVYELRQRGVGEANIRKALEEINETDYLARLDKLVRRKLAELKAAESSAAHRSAKVVAHLIARGFEGHLVRSAIAAIDGGDGG